jgi:hypothetical protein
MAEHIYKLGVQKTTGAAAGPIVSVVPAALASGSGMPVASGTGAITGGTVQTLNQLNPAGHTQLATSFATTQPTAPANFYDRAELQAVAGAGAIFTYLPGEWPLWAGATIPHVVIWQISALAVTYDVYVKVAE